MGSPVERIRRRYASSTTESCSENRCSLGLNGLAPESLAIIDGAEYQRAQRFSEKLCDRLVFMATDGLVVAVVELKGGGHLNMSAAIRQIQNGLTIVANIVGSCAVEGWYPVLAHRGRITPPMMKVLRNRPVQFRGKRKAVLRKRCGTQLATILGA